MPLGSFLSTEVEKELTNHRLNSDPTTCKPYNLSKLLIPSLELISKMEHSIHVLLFTELL